MKIKQQYIWVSVPLSHRMYANGGKASKKDWGTRPEINQFDLVRELAAKIHKNSFDGGGTGGGTYDMCISMPSGKMEKFILSLIKHNINDFDEPENYEDD